MGSKEDIALGRKHRGKVDSQPAACPHEMLRERSMKSLAAWFSMGELVPGSSSGSPPAPSLSSGGAWNTVHAPEEEATGLPLWLIPLLSVPCTPHCTCPPA